MRLIRRFVKRMGSWATRKRDEQRLAAEIEEHLAQETARNLLAGLPGAEARRQAVVKFGPVEAIKEDYRERRGLPFLETLLHDGRYALRRLRKSPVFTAAVVLTLALGIGATTAVFTLVHAVILKSLPVANPAELYRVGKEARCCYYGGYSQDNEFSIFSYDLYKHFRNNTPGFAELAAFQAGGAMFGVRRAGTGEAAQGYPGEFVSGNYFAMFGVQAYAGRLLTAADDRAGAPPVAVISYRLWQQRYGSDPSVVGALFNFDNKPFTVVGIAPPGFFGDKLRAIPPDYFLPLSAEPVVEADADLNAVATHWLDLIGRIRPGVNPQAVEADMRVELKQWLRSHWADMDANDRANFPQQTLFLAPGGAGITALREQYQHWLAILMLVSTFVLLIVCANVANLMLVRGMEHRPQTSLSMALGAQPARLVRQAMTECALLSLSGGAAGLAVAFAGTRLILRFAFPHIAGMGDVSISASPSLPVLLFAFGVSTIAGTVFGIAPAWVATRVDPIEALRGAARSTARAGSLPRRILVVFQAALALVLLAVSGLLTTALHNLENQKFGFAGDRRTIASIDPRLAGYHADQLTTLYRRLHDALAGIPGVEEVAVAMYTPLNGNNWGTGVWIEGLPLPGPHDDNWVSWDRVTAGWFEAIGTRIIAGRGITDQDRADSQLVAVVNQAFAHKYFPQQDPIGKHFGRTEMKSSRMYQIVGVSEDARYLDRALDQPVGPFFFLPEPQHDVLPNGEKDIDPGSHFLHDILIVTRPGARLTAAQVRQAVVSVDPNLPVISIQTLAGQVSGVFRQQHLIARLTSFFGILSLALASIGLYGVTAYNAGRRIREMGVRMALGATRAQTAALVVRGAFALVGVGLLVGFPLALAAGRFMGSQLYGLNPYDPFVIAASVLALALSALAASLIPAIRVSFVSPWEALRAE